MNKIAGKLKERTETKFIKVNQYPLHDKTSDEILWNSKKAGYMFFPHHYLITEDGKTTKMRPEESVAYGELENYDTTISVLADVTENAEVALKELLEALKETYKGVKINGV